MAVLLRAEPVGETSWRKVDVLVGQYLIFAHVPAESAALDKPLGQVVPGTHLVDVRGLAVGHVHAVLVQHLVGLEITLGDSADFDHRAGERWSDVVVQEGNRCDRVRGLEVREVVRDPEGVERTFAEFVELQVPTLLWIGVFGETEDLDLGGSDRVIDDPPSSRTASTSYSEAISMTEPLYSTPRDIPRA